MSAEKEENPSAFKHSIGRALLKRMGQAIKAVYPKFDQKSFEAIDKDLSQLELKPRVARVREELHSLLPDSYKEALAILLAAAKDGGLNGFDLWPFTDYVQTYGLNDRKRSLDALKVFTRLFTAEFAVRPFLKQDAEETLDYLLLCAKSKNEHDRRWASEGSRPRLPWGERLHDFVKDPRPTRPILDSLKFDESLYVRKSVANHLNDIAKDHPDYVIKVLKAWQKEAKTPDERKRLLWIIKHSLRSLIKAGHKEALKLIGVDSEIQLAVKSFRFREDTYSIGEELNFSLELHSKSQMDQNIVLDYVIHYRKANGQLNAKVFKWKTFTLAGKEKLVVSKKHSLKAVSTRVHYAGEHGLSIQVNGQIIETAKWSLLL